jgi:hypothetical protein
LRLCRFFVLTGNIDFADAVIRYSNTLPFASVYHFCFEYGVPFVDDVQKRGKIAVLLVGAVDAVVDDPRKRKSTRENSDADL